MQTSNLVTAGPIFAIFALAGVAAVERKWRRSRAAVAQGVWI